MMMDARKQAQRTARSTAQAAFDKMLLDQREANEKLLVAAIQAQELTELAETAQASAELLARKLQDSERELVATAESRERLLGIVGHDLRNPLGAISMCAQLLLAEGGSNRERISEFVRLLLKSVHRMNRMIQQLSEFTRARLGGGIPLELAPTDLRTICQTTLEELSFLSTVPIQHKFKGDTTGKWDAERLIEALSNLVGNAIDHANPGTAVLVKVYGQKDEVVLEVINQGSPIPKELIPGLFDAFRRGRLSSEARTGHLGLGLFIAHEIVKSHGGTITAHSSAGKTAFVIQLPRMPVLPGSAPAG